MCLWGPPPRCFVEGPPGHFHDDVYQCMTIVCSLWSSISLPIWTNFHYPVALAQEEEKESFSTPFWGTFKSSHVFRLAPS